MRLSQRLAGDSGISHSNTLLNDIDKLLHEAQVDLSEIDFFAVATGPGSFTGLRIGIATVKGLAATLNRPCAGVPTLQAVALSAGASERSVALLPAGRGEVFAQLFAVTKDGLVTELDQATHISPQRLIAKYGSLESVLWCGEGAIANKRCLRQNRVGRSLRRVKTSLHTLRRWRSQSFATINSYTRMPCKRFTCDHLMPS